MIDDRTSLDWPLPHENNRLAEDLPRLRAAIEAADAAVVALQAAIADAESSLAAHEAALDPHAQYLTQAEAGALYAPLASIDGNATKLHVSRLAEAVRLTITPENGEPVWTTDGGTLWIGDGASTGGVMAKADAVRLHGRAFSSAAPSVSDAIVWDGSQWGPGLANASKLQGRNVSSAAPVDGQAILWDSATSSFKPGDAVLGVGPGVGTLTAITNPAKRAFFASF